MAREIYGRLKLTGTLVTQGPLHVGGREGGIEADLLLARDGQGRVYIPGTGLAGALREWMETRFESFTGHRDKKQGEHLWGFQLEDEGHASWVRVADAVLEEPSLEIRSTSPTRKAQAHIARSCSISGTRWKAAKSASAPPARAATGTSSSKTRRARSRCSPRERECWPRSGETGRKSDGQTRRSSRQCVHYSTQ